MSKTENAAYETGRDLAAEPLKSVRELKAGKVQVVDSPVVEARKKTGSVSHARNRSSTARP